MASLAADSQDSCRKWAQGKRIMSIIKISFKDSQGNMKINPDLYQQEELTKIEIKYPGG